MNASLYIESCTEQGFVWEHNLGLPVTVLVCVTGNMLMCHGDDGQWYVPHWFVSIQLVSVQSVRYHPSKSGFFWSIYRSWQPTGEVSHLITGQEAVPLEHCSPSLTISVRMNGVFSALGLFFRFQLTNDNFQYIHCSVYLGGFQFEQPYQLWPVGKYTQMTSLKHFIQYVAHNSSDTIQTQHSPHDVVT